MKFSFDNFQEFLDWNLKRENRIKDLNEQMYSMGVEHAGLRDNLQDRNNELMAENDDLEIENAKLVDELSEAHYKIERLEKKLEDLKKIKMSDEVTIPDALKKSPAATDDE